MKLTIFLACLPSSAPRHRPFSSKILSTVEFREKMNTTHEKETRHFILSALIDFTFQLL